MKLSEIENSLKELVDATVHNGVSRHFIEIRDNDREFIVGGNPEGLLRLALELVKLAQNNVLGAHTHIDTSSIADIADKPLVLRRSGAPT